MDWNESDFDDELVGWLPGRPWGSDEEIEVRVKMVPEGESNVAPEQEAVAEYLESHGREVYAAIVAALREEYGDRDDGVEVDSGDDDWVDGGWDEGWKVDESFDHAPVATLFDDPESTGDWDEPGWDEDEDKFFVDRFELHQILIRKPHDGGVEYGVFGSAEWDPEHGVSVLLRDHEVVQIGGVSHV